METGITTPEWLPPVVVQMANYIAANALDMPAQVEAALIRLLTDERMNEVWEEISKHKRLNYKTSAEQFYPVNLPAEIASWAGLAKSWRREESNQRALGHSAAADQFGSWAAAAEARGAGSGPETPAEASSHDMAMATVLTLAIGHFSAGLRTMRRADFDAFIGHLRARGRTEEADAYVLQAADNANLPYFVTRKRTNAQIQAFVKGLGAQTKAMFGSPLYGVLAILTNVVFESADYNQQRIRALLR